MELIKTKREWSNYKKMYESKAEGFIPQHNIKEPQSFPFLVATHFDLDGTHINIYHVCVFKEECLELLKYCAKKGEKEVNFRHHID